MLLLTSDTGGRTFPAIKLEVTPQKDRGGVGNPVWCDAVMMSGVSPKLKAEPIKHTHALTVISY